MSLRTLLAAALLSVGSLTACDNATKPAETDTTPSVEIPTPQPIVKTSLDLTTVVAWAPAAVKVTDDVAELTTHPASGGFSGEIALPEAVRKPGSGKVRVVVSAPKGGVVINATKYGSSNSSLSERTVVLEADGEQAVVIELADMSQPTAILFANADKTGPSKVQIKSVEVEQ